LVFLVVGTILVLYGILGLLFDLHVVQRLAQGADLWSTLSETGRWAAPDAAYSWDPPNWWGALSHHFDRAVLWVWLAWSVGVFLLLVAMGRWPGFDRLPKREFDWKDVAALLLLAGVVGLAYLVRKNWLLPLDNGAIPISHYDEMVYLEAALLWRRGLQPYVDFFLAHPPGILYTLWPAVLSAELWGGEAFLIAGRWWQLAFGLVSITLLYLVSREVGGRRAGLLAALVLAVDVQAAYVAPLETVVNLATLVALALYVAGLKARRRFTRFLLLVFAGGAAVFSGLTKVPGGATLALLGLLALLGWNWRDLLAGVLGAVGTALLIVGPLAGQAPLAFFRQVVGFQLVRPQETLYGRNHLARMADYPESRVTFLLLSAALLLMTAAVVTTAWRARAGRREHPAEGAGWSWILPLGLVVTPLLFLFSYGRAYHSRYYVQLIVPFALLIAAGFGTMLTEARRWPLGARAAAVIVGMSLLLAAWPHLAQQRMTWNMVRYDGTYRPIGEALNEALSPGAVVLALDPGYPLMANRQPTSFPDGTLLVDGAGLLIYRALAIAERYPLELWQQSREFSHEIDPKAVFHLPAAQDLVLSGLYGSDASVIDPRIAAEDLTPQTQEFLSTRGQQILWQQYTAAFTVERSEMLGESECGLNLWDLNLRPRREGVDGAAVAPGEPLTVSPGDEIQVSLYWYVERRPLEPVKVSLELLDLSGQVVARLWAAPHFGDPPASMWQEGWVYQDHHNIAVPREFLPGRYSLVLALQKETGRERYRWTKGEAAEEGGLSAASIEVVR
jgi:hypothetical protein